MMMLPQQPLPRIRQCHTGVKRARSVAAGLRHCPRDLVCFSRPGLGTTLPVAADGFDDAQGGLCGFYAGIWLATEADIFQEMLEL